MGKVAMFATLSCVEGKGDEMDAVLASQVAAAADLDGVEVYSYHRGEDNEYSFFALFTSQDALQAHGAGRFAEGGHARIHGFAGRSPADEGVYPRRRYRSRHLRRTPRRRASV